MMTEAVLQILLLLAYLTIGLISVTFPIYAICVTYLKQERWESEKERKQRNEELKGKIHELTNELSGEPEDSNRFEEINRQIKESKKEQKLLKLRPYFLTAHGAVLRPVVILTLALIFACLGIYSFYEQDMGWTIGFAISSALTILTAIANLYQTISIIEYAALRPARTIEFDVSFGDGEKIMQLKRGKESVVEIFACTSEANVNNCVMYVTIPAQIEVSRETKTEKITVSKRPNLSLIVDVEGFCPKNWKFGLRGAVVPKEIGRYTVDVSICAEGIYEYEDELIFEVAK